MNTIMIIFLVIMVIARYFIKNIETEQPKICDYLKYLGINPLKPFELMSIYHEKYKKLNI